MKIGQMRHRITFEKMVKVDDGYLGSTVTWHPVCVVWASVEALSGREYFYAGQIKAEVTHRVTIRYNSKISTEMRINHGGKILMIESIIEKGLQEIFAREEK
jgi:SPP1 family predicted phage head-tail adaptor